MWNEQLAKEFEIQADDVKHITEMFGTVAHYMSLMRFYRVHNHFPHNFTLHDQDTRAMELTKDAERFGVVHWHSNVPSAT